MAENHQYGHPWEQQPPQTELEPHELSSGVAHWIPGEVTLDRSTIGTHHPEVLSVNHHHQQVGGCGVPAYTYLRGASEGDNTTNMFTPHGVPHEFASSQANSFHHSYSCPTFTSAEGYSYNAGGDVHGIGMAFASYTPQHLPRTMNGYQPYEQTCSLQDNAIPVSMVDFDYSASSAASWAVAATFPNGAEHQHGVQLFHHHQQKQPAMAQVNFGPCSEEEIVFQGKQPFVRATELIKVPQPSDMSANLSSDSANLLYKGGPDGKKLKVQTSLLIDSQGHSELIPNFLSNDNKREFEESLKLKARINKNLREAEARGDARMIHEWQLLKLNLDQERTLLFEAYKERKMKPKKKETKNNYNSNSSSNSNSNSERDSKREKKIVDTLTRRFIRFTGRCSELQKEVEKLEHLCGSSNNQLASPGEYSSSSTSASASYSSPSQHALVSHQNKVDHAASLRYQASPPCIQFNLVPGAPGNDSSIADLASILSRLSCAERVSRFAEPSSPSNEDFSLTKAPLRLYNINIGVKQAIREPEKMGPRLKLGYSTPYEKLEHLDYEFLIAENVHKKEGWLCHLYRIAQAHFDFVASLREWGMPFCQAGFEETAPLNVRQIAKRFLPCTWLAGIYHTALLPESAHKGVVSVGSTFQPLVVQSGDFRPPLTFATVGEALKVVDIMRMLKIHEKEYLLLQILCLFMPSEGDKDMKHWEAYYHYHAVLSRVVENKERMEFLEAILNHVKAIGQLAVQRVRSLPLPRDLLLLKELFGEEGLAVEDTY